MKKYGLLLLMLLPCGWLNAALVLENLNLNVDNVTFIGHAGDQRLFIAQQAGQMLIYDQGALSPSPFLDVSALVNSGFEQGLLSFAFHPDYANNGFVFVFYSDLNNHATVARYRRSDSDANAVDPASATVVYAVDEGTGHYGGQLGFGPDGYLYVSIGDGGSQQDPECDAQDPMNVLGSILRIDVDQNVDTPPHYGIPADNPFSGGAGEHDAEVWSFGFRNPWRFSFDRLTGDFYFSDVGQFTREEVNFLAAGSAGGQNYGWKAMEGTFCHDANDPPSNCPTGTPICGAVELIAPAIEYDHSQSDCSITGGYVYRGQLASQLRGEYLAGDWCSGTIRASQQINQVWQTRILSISLPRITTFGEDVHGELYASDGDAIHRIINDDLIFVDGFN